MLRILGFIASTLVTGLGQLVRGRLRRAWIFAAVEVVVAAVAVFAILHQHAWAFLLLLPVKVGSVLDAALGPQKPRRLSWLATVGVMVALVAVSGISNLGIRTRQLEAFSIPSGSMLPTLEVGDHIFVDKRDHERRRGDVVVFRHRQDNGVEVDLVKRIIAVGGDTIQFTDGQPILNDHPVERKAVGGACSYWDRNESAAWWQVSCQATDETLDGRTYRVYGGASHQDFPAFTVPHGSVYVVGDNRDNSHDSRFFGAVPVADVKGVVLSVWASFGPKGMRTERFGKPVR